MKYKDKHGNEWDLKNLSKNTLDLHEVIDSYEYKEIENTRKYGSLFSYNQVKNLQSINIPTLKEILDLMESFKDVSEFCKELQILPGGMYDFTNIEQWVGKIACFLTITDNIPKVIMIDIIEESYNIGNFHPDDCVSIRTINRKTP